MVTVAFNVLVVYKDVLVVQSKLLRRVFQACEGLYLTSSVPIAVVEGTNLVVADGIEECVSPNSLIHSTARLVPCTRQILPIANTASHYSNR